VKNIRVNNTKAAETNEETPVRAFDAKLIAEREKEPLTGIE
jgi:hypothetical protein